MKKTLTLILVGALLGSTAVFATSKFFSDVPADTWYTEAVASLSEKGIIQGYPDGTFGPGNAVNRAELAVMLDRMIEYIETGDVLKKYTNVAFGYSFVIPEGLTVNTQKSMVIYPIEHEKAIEVGVEFEDSNYALLSSMQDQSTFPELKDRLNFSAEEYIQTWWEENKYDDNPYIDILISPVFEKNINGINWYGFEVNNGIVSANGSGGSLLTEPMTVMMTKHNGIFYRWQYTSSVADDLLVILESFKFI